MSTHNPRSSFKALLVLLILFDITNFSVTAEEEEKHVNAKDYYDASNTARNYKETWGEGNIHFGYFPDKSVEELKKLVRVGGGPGGNSNSNKIDGKTASQKFQDSAGVLTQRIGKIGGIKTDSTVLDMGCGYGKPLMDLVEYSKPQLAVGLDIATNHIKAARARAEKYFPLEVKSNKLRFVEGSYLELDKNWLNKNNIDNKGFSHVVSNVAFCHLHTKLPEILANAFRALQPGGVLTAVDYLGKNQDTNSPNYKISDLTLEHVYKRLTFSKLVGHDEYKRLLIEAGFVIEHYEVLDEHICYGYALLEAAARQGNFKSADGSLLADNYRETVKSCDELKEIGMNLYRARKPESEANGVTEGMHHFNYSEL